MDNVTVTMSTALNGRTSAREYSLLAVAAGLSDAALLSRVVALAGSERAATVELVTHLAELDSRRLYLAEGFGSLFAYCTGALRLAEHAAYNRIEAARASRRFPAVLDLLAQGSLNLSNLRLLAPHLRPDNFVALVGSAAGKSKREVELLVAGLAPRPDVAASVRRLPGTTGFALPQSATASVTAPSGHPGSGAASSPAPKESAPREEGAFPGFGVASLDVSGTRPTVTPLTPERFQVGFTIGADARRKLRQVQDLLRREIPDGDPGAIFERALTLLLEDVTRRKLASTSTPRPRGKPATGSGPRDGVAVSRRSRHIPARVKREVWLRDEGRCAFVAANGRRCGETAFLEFHHREPYGIGGEPTVGNISLRCRAHNVHEAEPAFGSSWGGGAELAPGRVVRTRC